MSDAGGTQPVHFTLNRLVTVLRHPFAPNAYIQLFEQI
jgi:hypothetical protein